MPDKKSNRSRADRIRINLNEKYEFQRWKKALNVSGQALAGAVRVVGPLVDDVKAYLKAKRTDLH